MKVICNRGALLEALTVTGNAVQARTPKPVLLCVKLTAGEYANMPGTDAELHAAAALKLCAKMNWEGDLIEGGTKDGCVFVFADSPRITNPTVDKRRDTRTVEQQNDFMGEVLKDI